MERFANDIIMIRHVDEDENLNGIEKSKPRCSPFMIQCPTES